MAGSPEPQNNNRDGSHAFLFTNLSRGQEGLYKSRNEKTIILIAVCAISYWML